MNVIFLCGVNAPRENGVSFGLCDRLLLHRVFIRVYRFSQLLIFFFLLWKGLFPSPLRCRSRYITTDFKKNSQIFQKFNTTVKSRFHFHHSFHHPTSNNVLSSYRLLFFAAQKIRYPHTLLYKTDENFSGSKRGHTGQKATWKTLFANATRHTERYTALYRTYFCLPQNTINDDNRRGSTKRNLEYPDRDFRKDKNLWFW